MDQLQVRSIDILKSSHSHVEISKFSTTMSFEEKIAFQRLILRLSKALFMYGAPSYRVEKRIQHVAREFRVPVDIICQPSFILISFGDFGLAPISPPTRTEKDDKHILPTSLQNTFFIKVEQTFNMGKLQDVDYLATCIAEASSLQSNVMQFEEIPITASFETIIDLNDVAHLSRLKRYQKISMYWLNYYFGRQKPFDLENATIYRFLQVLEEIVARPETYPKWLRLLTLTFMSGLGAIIIFQGTWTDGLVSMILGFIVACIILISERYSITTAEVLVSFVVSILSQLVKNRIAPSEDLCLGVITLSPMLSMYPGVAMTLSMLEMASKNMNAGSVRMFYSFIRSLKLGFGLSLGSRLIKWFTGDAMQTKCSNGGQSIAPYAFLLLIPFSVFSCIHLKGHWRQLPMMFLTTLFGYFTNRLAQMVFSKDVSSAFAAFVIGVVSNTYARRFNDIALSSLLAAIICMVPGAVGVIGFYEMLHVDSAGTNFALDICIRTMSLSLGLYVSTLVYFPMKRKVRGEVMTL